MGKRVVLVGAGHAHLYVARHCAALARAGAETVLVSPERFWYSGMAAGMLGGMYDPEACSLDPAALCARSGARHVRSRMIAHDGGARRIHTDDGAVWEYDLLSFNIGSVAEIDAIPGASRHAASVKPIAGLAEMRRRLEEGFRAGVGPGRAAVIGGGASGCEIAANLAWLASRHGARLEVALLTGGARLLEDASPGASRALARALRERGISVQFGARVREVTASGVALEGGGDLKAGLVIAAPGLAAPAVWEQFGLPGGREGLRVDRRLRCEGHPAVFGAGDCIYFAGRALPRAGVYGVRQARVLLHNLAASLRGTAPRRYRPQALRLAILNLGWDEGFAVYGPLWWSGRASMRWKHWLDTRFLAQYGAG